MNDYAALGVFPSAFMWKGILRKCINAFHLNMAKTRLSEDESMKIYMNYFPNISTPCEIWLLSKKSPKLLKECQSTIKLLADLFSHDYIKTCHKCATHIKSLSLHLVFHCTRNESRRIKFWREIYIKFGFEIYATLIKLDFKSQITFCALVLVRKATQRENDVLF